MFGTQINEMCFETRISGTENVNWEREIVSHSLVKTKTVTPCHLNGWVASLLDCLSRFSKFIHK